jgi:glycosyltransferase involved in cell wall biosynthesis
MLLSFITATRNRSHLLFTNALPSILSQSDRRFEWIVVNDGGDIETRMLVKQQQTDIAIRYLEIEHAADGFGLCHARNAGLGVASGELISYLDDDNAIAPTFVEQVQHFFEQQIDIQCAMVQQQRRRDVVQVNQVVKSGQPFISPTTVDVADLVEQRQLFDSNGFVHRSCPQLLWNPNFRVFADYEFLLQCLGLWGVNSYRLIELVLVDYVQRSDGVIGRSSYDQWAMELERILERSKWYSVLTAEQIRTLEQLVQRWQCKMGQCLPAFR